MHYRKQMGNSKFNVNAASAAAEERVSEVVECREHQLAVVVTL